MNVPLLDLQQQYASIRSDVLAAITRVCDSQHFIMGPEVEALEAELAAAIGARFAIAVSSGTDALLVALMALGVGPGDEVITPTFSFFATAGCVSRLGATPIFVDVDDQTLMMDAGARRARRSRRGRARSSRFTCMACAPTWRRCSNWRRSTTSRSSKTPRRRSAPPTSGGRQGRSARSAASRSFPARTSVPSAMPAWCTTDDADTGRAHPPLAESRCRAEVLPPEIGGNFRHGRTAGGGAARQAAAPAGTGRSGAAPMPQPTANCSPAPALRRAFVCRLNPLAAATSITST